jgi:regulator of sigma E protease
MYFQAGLHIRRFLVDSPLGPRSDLFDGITNVYELPSAADPSQGNWGDEILQVDDVVFEKRLATPEDFRMAMANTYGGEKGMPRLILVKFRKPDGTEKSVGIANPLLSYRAVLGIQLTETYGGSLLKYDAGRAIGIGLKEPFETVGLTAYSVYMMFTGEAKTNELAGPVGIFQLAMRTAKMGPASLLKFLAFLTVSLAILNILPIPVLDGGHILFLGIEKVRGRPISEKMRARLEMVGLVLILMLVVFALRNDIYRGTGMI